jgi:hypothetical protein
MKKNIYFYSNLLAWGLVLFLITNHIFGWTTPTENPPGGNITPSFSQWTTSGSDIYYNTGNVGIGVVSPGSQLHIGGTTPQVRIGDDGAEDTSLVFMGNAQDFYVALDDTTDDLTIGTGTTIGSNVRMVVEYGGNVGIGTITPGAELEVNGNIIASSPTADNHVATKGYVDASSGSVSRWRIVKTTNTYNGNLGGYEGANDKCQSEFGADSFFFNRTIFASSLHGGLPLYLDARPYNAWWACLDSYTATYYMTGMPANWDEDTNSYYGNCEGWTSSSSVNYGSYIDGDGDAYYDTCETVYPLMCAIPE